LSQLSNQFSLALVKNPSVLRSTSSTSASAPSKAKKRGRCECEDHTEEKVNSSKPVKKYTPFRKYVLPKDAPPEYYQCMDCGERRPENSFQNDHSHFGKRPKVRWYCPLCKNFFAVTHRSGHIKCRHPSSESSSAASSPSNETIPDVDVLKPSEHSVVSSPRRPIEEEEESVVCPARKYVCVPSEQTEVCSATHSRVSSSDDITKVEPTVAPCVLPNSPPEENEVTSEAFVPVVRVPSTPSMFNTASVSGLYPEEDLLPAFRCPSYVLMPDNGFAAEKPSDNSGFIFM